MFNIKEDNITNKQTTMSEEQLKILTEEVLHVVNWLKENHYILETPILAKAFNLDKPVTTYCNDIGLYCLSTKLPIELENIDFDTVKNKVIEANQKFNTIDIYSFVWSIFDWKEKDGKYIFRLYKEVKSIKSNQGEKMSESTFYFERISEHMKETMNVEKEYEITLSVGLNNERPDIGGSLYVKCPNFSNININDFKGLLRNLCMEDELFLIEDIDVNYYKDAPSVVIPSYLYEPIVITKKVPDVNNIHMVIDSLVNEVTEKLNTMVLDIVRTNDDTPVRISYINRDERRPGKINIMIIHEPEDVNSYNEHSVLWDKLLSSLFKHEIIGLNNCIKLENICRVLFGIDYNEITNVEYSAIMDSKEDNIFSTTLEPDLVTSNNLVNRVCTYRDYKYIDTNIGEICKLLGIKNEEDI